MRRCQYVVQCPERVRRWQRLNVEYVDRRAGDLLVLQHIDQSLFVDNGPRDALISRAVGFILCSSAGPTRPRVRLLNTKWIVRMSACSNSWCLETRTVPAALATSG